MRIQYQIKKKTARAAETLLVLNCTQYQARRVADALSYVYTQTDARSLELCVGMGENEKCIARWTYKGLHDGRTEQTR